MVGVSQVTFSDIQDSKRQWGETTQTTDVTSWPEKQLSDRGGGTVMKEKGMSLRARPDLGRGLVGDPDGPFSFCFCKGSWELEPGGCRLKKLSIVAPLFSGE
jgi:hypothetical protein